MGQAPGVRNCSAPKDRAGRQEPSGRPHAGACNGRQRDVLFGFKGFGREDLSCAAFALGVSGREDQYLDDSTWLWAARRVQKAPGSDKGGFLEFFPRTGPDQRNQPNCNLQADSLGSLGSQTVVNGSQPWGPGDVSPKTCWGDSPLGAYLNSWGG